MREVPYKIKVIVEWDCPRCGQHRSQVLDKWPDFYETLMEPDYACGCSHLLLTQKSLLHFPKRDKGEE